MFTKGHTTNIGSHHSEETRAKMSKSMRGKKRSAKARKNISLGKMGIKLSEEHKKKISDSMKGARGYWFGKKLSEETKQKLRVANTGKKLSDETKRKCAMNVEKLNERILKEIREFENQGFRCVPVGGKVRPDFIAIKDSKVFAVEVEYGIPNYAKYTAEAKVFFDDIMWIIRKKR